MTSLLCKFALLLLFPFVSSSEAVHSGGVTTPHPFYVAVTEINHNATEKTFEISCKFFADDFEQVLERTYKTQLDISAAKDKAVFDKYIPDYVNRHLSISVDGKPVSLHYVGFEKEKESAYAYFEITNVASVKNVTAVNSLLHDFIEQQINIMHVTIGGKRQSTKLDYPNAKAAFQF